LLDVGLLLGSLVTGLNDGERDGDTLGWIFVGDNDGAMDGATDGVPSPCKKRLRFTSEKKGISVKPLQVCEVLVGCKIIRSYLTPEAGFPRPPQKPLFPFKRPSSWTSQHKLFNSVTLEHPLLSRIATSEKLHRCLSTNRNKFLPLI
jgi:hypothetical protein